MGLELLHPAKALLVAVKNPIATKARTKTLIFRFISTSLSGITPGHKYTNFRREKREAV